jgi:DNA modification methylase
MIYKRDFRKGLEELIQPGMVNLVVTSPPYFDARNYGGEKLFDNRHDWMYWCLYSIELLCEYLAPGGVIWWNTGSGYRDYKKMIEIYKLIGLLDNAGIYLIDEIPWIKKSSPPKNIKNRPYPGWEHNFIFAPNPKEVTFYRDNVRRPYAESTLSRMKYATSKLSATADGEYEGEKRVKPNPGGATPPNWLLLPQDTTGRPHPAPMVPDLANWAIRAYSDVGDLVLDPMAGIGTTWIEAIKLGRLFMGFELFPDYIKIANLSMKRLQRGDDPYRGLKKEWEKNE